MVGYEQLRSHRYNNPNHHRLCWFVDCCVGGGVIMAAPINPNGGRPLRFKTVADLQKAIDEYFDYCDNRVKNVYIKEAGENVPVSYPAPYTMSGLARALGLSRQALSEYSHREQFGDAIKAARDRVQEDIETRLMETSNQSGAIFNLKNNFGWRDKTEQDITTNGDAIQPILVQFVGEDVKAIDESTND